MNFKLREEMFMKKIMLVALFAMFFILEMVACSSKRGEESKKEVKVEQKIPEKADETEQNKEVEDNNIEVGERKKKAWEML